MQVAHAVYIHLTMKMPYLQLWELDVENITRYRKIITVIRTEGPRCTSCRLNESNYSSQNENLFPDVQPVHILYLELRAAHGLIISYLQPFDCDAYLGIKRLRKRAV